jgi:hypothetical protein
MDAGPVVEINVMKIAGLPKTMIADSANGPYVA